MLLQIVKGIAKGVFSGKAKEKSKQSASELVAQAGQMALRGDKHGAVALYRQALELDPHNVEVINDLASFLIDLNQEDEAGELYRRATVLDDSFAPGLVNYALFLNTHFQSGLAEEYLEQARRHAPGVPYIDAILGGVKMMRGRPTEAISDYLSAWLKDFDNTKFAHTYLFNRTYSEVADAGSIVAEHVFWAETLAEHYRQQTDIPVASGLPIGRKIRVGYLSPDFRQHSVRYFIRPLLENHDRDRFEIFGYSDMEWEDSQTEKIRQQCDVFRKIANLPNDTVREILLGDRLDILVELAGHTSSTRLAMLSARFASVQITALGYPPTTGLNSIDYKMVDWHAAPRGTESLYSERLLRLRESFWCFNPLEETPAVAPSPCIKNGYITFGCFGNVAKISPLILSCWVDILKAVPESRLLLKSLTFQDEDALNEVRGRFVGSGIGPERLRFDKPDPPERLFDAYADIDVVLDTYPFNGGTTTCFAVWMGVPFVTLAGDALISRMGVSMARSLGLDAYVALDGAGYARAALELVADRSRLAALRQEIRPRMLASALGNGAMYARDVESAYLDALRAPASEASMDRSPPPVLDSQEVARRAEFVMAMGNLDGAGRIVDYLQRHAPRSALGFILRAKLREKSDDSEGARKIIQETLDAEACDDPRALRINLARYCLALGDYPATLDVCARVDRSGLDKLGGRYLDLYRLAATAWSNPESEGIGAQNEATGYGAFPTIAVLLPSGDTCLETGWRARLAASNLDARIQVHRLAADVPRHQACMELALDDAVSVVVLLRENVDSIAPDPLAQVVHGLHDHDIVGPAGTAALAGMYWFSAGYDAVCGALIQPAGDRRAGYELSVYGPGGCAERSDICMLDGSFIAMRRQAWAQLDFDASLAAVPGLAEQDWTYRMAGQGSRVGVLPELGVVNTLPPGGDQAVWRDTVERFLGKHGMTMDVAHEQNMAGVSLDLSTPERALPVLNEMSRCAG
jgi:predicted O-linked N-acetylglucosamine transferase (SPINDLY family)